MTDKDLPKGETPDEALFRIAAAQTGAVITFRLTASGRFDGTPAVGDEDAHPAHAKAIVEAFEALVNAIRKAGGQVGGELAIDDGSPQNVTILEAGSVPH